MDDRPLTMDGPALVPSSIVHRLWWNTKSHQTARSGQGTRGAGLAHPGSPCSCGHDLYRSHRRRPRPANKCHASTHSARTQPGFRVAASGESGPLRPPPRTNRQLSEMPTPTYLSPSKPFDQSGRSIAQEKGRRQNSGGRRRYPVLCYTRVEFAIYNLPTADGGCAIAHRRYHHPKSDSSELTRAKSSSSSRATSPATCQITRPQRSAWRSTFRA